ncbi:endonuclease MutS2 [Arcobacter sp. FWKO B]|uniref:endonuclease MutS2 n=1 Tax=Arcobacter sp. FWKO B TaxID=2593672 RepID=UPI003A4C64F4
MTELINKLDLEQHISKLKSFFAREKDIIFEGDVSYHYKLISELSNYTFKDAPKVANLDSQLMHIQKLGVLKIYEIYEFVKIINYFAYLKRQRFEGGLFAWFEKIEIPSEILKVSEYFDDKGEIKSGVNEELDSVNHALYKNKEEIRTYLQKLIHTQKLQPYLVDNQIHLVNGDEALLLRGGFNHILKGSIVDRSQGGFFYVVPHTISELKQKRDDLQNHKLELVYKISKEISSTFNKWLKFLQFINKEFDKIDHYLARISFSRSGDLNFILPTNSKTHTLVEFCHPALHHPKPITIDFSKKVIMLTGVNAGGKTMVLKSLLSSVLMSKYLVPFRANKKSQIPHFKHIEAILDDPQNVKNDISTFAGRMVQFSTLFSKDYYIVGVDEIELGTDSDEAAVLFHTIIEELIKKNIKVIITTHHKRLAAMLSGNNEVELYAALYDEVNEKPTYEFLQGTIGRSYAFETAGRYGIPKYIIEKTKVAYGEDKFKLNELIQKSATLEMELKLKIEKLDNEIANTLRLKDSLKNQRDEFQEELNTSKAKLHKEYQQAINEARAAIKAKDVSESHRYLNAASKFVKNVETPQIKEDVVFEVGDMVKYKSSKGEILSIKGEKAFVDIDGIKMQVFLKELKKSGVPKTTPKQKPKTTLNVEKPTNAGVSLDLHGLRSDEAIEQLDKFISDCLIAGFDEVLVYHGIGTGKLSFAVKEFLRTHPKVKSFTDAHPSQGGFGAKVVKL